MKTRSAVIALGMVSSLAFLACSGEAGVDGVNGADGTSCYAKALKDSSGFELYCGDEYVGTLKNGEDGAKGDKGDKGDSGAKGDTGDKGEKGNKGDTGAPGENGRNGLNGENGKNGTSCTMEPLATKDGYKVICAGDSVGVLLNGTNGENGLSAYQIAVANGFTGSEEEWVASLKGDPGAAGTSCTAEEITGGVKITCTDGKTYTLNNGTDGKDGRNFDEDWMVDPRDRQLYRVVTIGEQTWMAHNLNYETDSGSYCYRDSTKYCKKYGRLYTWATAMDSAGTWTTNGKGCGDGKTCSPTYPVRGVCPEGWHLPDTTERNALFDAVGGKETAGTMLKFTEGWHDKYDGTSGNGSDTYSFSALPAGLRISNGTYDNEGNNAYFWSSTENNSSSVYYMALYSNYDDAYLGNNGKNYGFSVRCVKD